MPTILSHAVIPLALGLGLGSTVISRRLLTAGTVAAMLPDLDVLALRFNIAYADSFGHRGASHSIAFALLLAAVAAMCARRLHGNARTAFVFVGVCAASHGLLDMFTNGGHGVALWWPITGERYFAAWQVIEVSPLNLRRVFSGKGLEVLQSEVLWIWLPAAMLFVVLVLLRRDPIAGSIAASGRETS